MVQRILQAVLAGGMCHILRIADDAVAQRFLFDLPWDMEQTVKAVTFEGKIDCGAYARRRPGIHIPV